MSNDINPNIPKPPALSNNAQPQSLSLPKYPVYTESNEYGNGRKGNHIANLKFLILNGLWISIVATILASIGMTITGNETVTGYWYALGLFLILILAFAIVPFVIASFVWAVVNALFMKLAVDSTKNKKLSALSAAFVTALCCYLPLGLSIDFSVAFWIVVVNFVGSLMLNINYLSTSIEEPVKNYPSGNVTASSLPIAGSQEETQVLPYTSTAKIEKDEFRLASLPYKEENEAKELEQPQPLMVSSPIELPKLAPATLSGSTIFTNPEERQENSSWKTIIRSLFVRGVLINTVVSTSIIGLAAIPLVILISFISALSAGDTDGAAGEIFFFALLSGIIMGIVWGLLNGIFLCLSIMFIKNKLASDLLAPLAVGILAFALLITETFNASKTAGVSLNFFVYGGIGLWVIANIITSMVINRNSKIKVTPTILRRDKRY